MEDVRVQIGGRLLSIFVNELFSECLLMHLVRSRIFRWTKVGIRQKLREKAFSNTRWCIFILHWGTEKIVENWIQSAQVKQSVRAEVQIDVTNHLTNCCWLQLTHGNGGFCGPEVSTENIIFSCLFFKVVSKHSREAQQDASKLVKTAEQAHTDCRLTFFVAMFFDVYKCWIWIASQTLSCRLLS